MGPGRLTGMNAARSSSSVRSVFCFNGARSIDRDERLPSLVAQPGCARFNGARSIDRDERQGAPPGGDGRPSSLQWGPVD